MIWNDRIRDLRKRQNMTLKEIAQRLQTTEATAQRYETTIKNIPYDVIEKYANIFNVTPAYIMGWDKGIRLREFIDADNEYFEKCRAIKADKSLTREQKLEKIGELQEPLKFAHKPSSTNTSETPKEENENSGAQHPQDYLIDDLIKRLYEIPPRQRVKVVDAILTMLDFRKF